MIIASGNDSSEKLAANKKFIIPQTNTHTHMRNIITKILLNKKFQKINFLHKKNDSSAIILLSIFPVEILRILQPSRQDQRTPKRPYHYRRPFLFCQ